MKPPLEYRPKPAAQAKADALVAAKELMQRNADELRKLRAEKDAHREKRKLYMRQWRKQQS